MHTKTSGCPIGTHEEPTSFSKVGSLVSLMHRRAAITLTILKVPKLPVDCFTMLTSKFESCNQAMYKTPLSLLYACQSMTSCVVPCIKLKGAFETFLHQDVHERRVGPRFCGIHDRGPNCIPALLNGTCLLLRPRVIMHACPFVLPCLAVCSLRKKVL